MDKHGRSMPDAFARISLNLDLKAVICGYDLFRKNSTILHTYVILTDTSDGRLSRA